MKITIDIPDALAQKMKTWTKEKGISASSLFTEAVEEYLQALKREQAFEELENLIGTPVAPDFDTQLANLRRDDPI